MYHTAMIDLYSRFIVGWSISNTMEAEWVTRVVKDAVEAHGKPEIMNSDQGVQFTSDSYLSYLKSQETIKISVDGKGRAINKPQVHIAICNIEKLLNGISHLFSAKYLQSYPDEFVFKFNNRFINNKFSSLAKCIVKPLLH